MKGDAYIAQILKQEGVEWLSCFPSNPMIEALAKEGIRPIAFRHERGAVMAADGYSRVSDRKKLGVVAMQSQAGAENSAGGLAQANADNIPILVLPGGNPLNMLFVRPNYSASYSWTNVVRHAEFITGPRETGNVMRRAMHRLKSSAPGPVVVELPPDVVGQDIPDDALNYRSPRPVVGVPSAGDIKDAARALVDAKDPLIWAGSGVMSAQATEELKQLAELLEVPVYTSLPGKSAIDERHPLAVGSGGLTTTGPARKWLKESDLIFAVGSSLTTTPYGQQFAQEKFLIHSVNDVDEINKDTVCDIGLVGDARQTLILMIDAVKGLIGASGRKTGTTERIKAERDQWWASWMPYLENDSTPISPYRVIWELNQNLDKENSIVTHDAGAPRDQMAPFYTATTPHSYVGWGKTTHLGASIPLMIGAKKAMPERMCVAFLGDAAFGMSGLDIETACRAELPITVVLLNNGIMATYPGGTPTAREQFGVTHMTGDYAQIAMGMGAEGIHVTRASELPGAIKQAEQFNKEGKTVMIDVKTRNEDSRAPARFVEKNTVN
ncbi:MAG: thiamine pyrophosphate-binding protein [Proteobacteria bacterium]|jgi:acetolactate synthase I/II/III large subunit|nr:thiamine pyrophosphate-binding protein [Pseudomonadota bacterium]MDA1298670.1 thiamine pyrophosphate-binding protein [Pseudomonadota bacterium]